MITKTEWNCGCVTRTSATRNIIYIDYCPLHAAAPKMLGILNGLIWWRDNTMGPDLDNMLAIIKEADDIVELVTKESE